MTDNTAELAIWITDDDDPRKIAWWKEHMAPDMLNESASANGVVVAAPTFRELKPGEGRAGTPPDTIQGTNVRLLVAEARVIGMVPHFTGVRFVDDLKYEDLQTLRKATRRAYLKMQGNAVPLSDEDCDHIIDLLGPDAAERALKEAINATKH